MSRRYVVLLLVLGTIWGSSYLFIKIGVRDLSAPVLVEARLLCAAPILVAFAASRYGWRALADAWRHQADARGNRHVEASSRVDQSPGDDRFADVILL